MRRAFNSNRNGVALGVGVAALLAAAVVPMAVAVADDYTWSPFDTKIFPEGVDQTSGIPPFYQEALGTGYFGYHDVADVTATNPDGLVGVFQADVSQLSTAFGFSNEELLVIHEVPGGTIYPSVGSVLDTASFGNGFENVYTDLVGEGPNGTNLITDMFNTPFGDFLIPTTFDAAALTTGDFIVLP